MGIQVACGYTYHHGDDRTVILRQFRCVAFGKACQDGYTEWFLAHADWRVRFHHCFTRYRAQGYGVPSLSAHCRRFSSNHFLHTLHDSTGRTCI